MLEAIYCKYKEIDKKSDALEKEYIYIPRERALFSEDKDQGCSGILNLLYQKSKANEGRTHVLITFSHSRKLMVKCRCSVLITSELSPLRPAKRCSFRTFRILTTRVFRDNSMKLRTHGGDDCELLKFTIEDLFVPTCWMSVESDFSRMFKASCGATITNTVRTGWPGFKSRLAHAAVYRALS